MNKFCKRLRYSVGGTYRDCGPGKSLSVDKGSPASFLSSQKGLRRKATGGASILPNFIFRCPFYSDNT